MKANDIVQAAYRALKRKKRGEKVEGRSEI